MASQIEDEIILLGVAGLALYWLFTNQASPLNLNNPDSAINLVNPGSGNNVVYQTVSNAVTGSDGGGKGSLGGDLFSALPSSQAAVNAALAPTNTGAAPAAAGVTAVPTFLDNYIAASMAAM